MSNETVSSGRRVLVIDDHDISRRFTVAALLQSGFTVKQAVCVEEAVKIACDWLPEVIFTDWHLPEGHGGDVVRGVQKSWRKGHPLPRLVLMTGESPDALTDGIFSGFDNVLLKPCTAAALADEARPGISCAVMESPVEDAEIRQLFRQELEQRLPELDTLLANGQTRAAAAITHQLIASSQICGEQRLAIAFRLLDSVCRERPAAEELAQHYLRLLAAAHDFLARV